MIPGEPGIILWGGRVPRAYVSRPWLSRRGVPLKSPAADVAACSDRVGAAESLCLGVTGAPNGESRLNPEGKESCGGEADDCETPTHSESSAFVLGRIESASLGLI